MNDLLRGKLRGKAPVIWNETALHSFEESKKALVQAALLAFPASQALLAAKKLSNAEKKYGAYDRELLAVYKSIKHFRHMVKGRNFAVFTDHKLLISAFRQRIDKCSPRQLGKKRFRDNSSNR